MFSLRDPLWNSIRVDEPFTALVDSAPFQRLRYVRQLGLAHLVYPGATHSRFEHALGAFHLTARTLRRLQEAGTLETLPADEPAILRAAALLHDIGHYPFSHALEEIGVPHHEEVARPLLLDGELGDRLRTSFGPTAPARILALIRGESDSPLQGLISGSLDLDKIDYLKRDAVMCGVPYGEIDVDRLLDALLVLTDPTTGRRMVGVRAKGLSALESLLFAKYQMYRNVYWHHAVRSATAMYKRLVDDALRTEHLSRTGLADHTDEGLLHLLAERAPSTLLERVRTRRLYKRAMECPAAELADLDLEWLAEDLDRTRRTEEALGARLGLAPGELLLDYPRKERMLGLDLPIAQRDGTVHRLTDAAIAGAINLPVLAEELYRSARWLRVFTAERRSIPRADVLSALAG